MKINGFLYCLYVDVIDNAKINLIHSVWKRIGVGFMMHFDVPGTGDLVVVCSFLSMVNLTGTQSNPRLVFIISYGI